jgi:hypothetical protein
VPWLTDVPVWQLPVVYGIPMICALALGGAAAAVYVRFGQTGLWLGSLAAVIVTTVAALLVTAFHGWLAIGRWFAALTPMTLSGWLVVVTLVGLATTYAVLRRVSV